MLNAGRLRYRNGRITPGAVFTGLTTVVVALLATRDAAVQVTANQYPQLAVRLAPANATAITNVFDKAMLDPQGLKQDYGRWANAARQALRGDPLNASGLRMLAYVSEMNPANAGQARNLMLLSEHASRRDLLAQIWLIEDDVNHGDIAGTLEHYDRALSVKPSTAGQFFPILVAAISEPAIRQALVPYLRANRPWVPSFLSVLVEKSTDPASVVSLFQRYGGARAVPGHGVYETTLLKRLVAAGDFQAAEAFAKQMDPRTDISAFGFSAATIQPRLRPLSWALYDGADGKVGLENAGALAITVRPEVRIVAASRVLPTLPRGAILRLRIAYPDPTETPLVTWRAYCRRAGRPPQQFWVRDMPATASETVIEVRMDAPTDCQGVQIDVEATGASGSSDSKATIDRLTLAAR